MHVVITAGVDVFLGPMTLLGMSSPNETSSYNLRPPVEILENGGAMLE